MNFSFRKISKNVFLGLAILVLIFSSFSNVFAELETSDVPQTQASDIKKEGESSSGFLSPLFIVIKGILSLVYWLAGTGVKLAVDLIKISFQFNDYMFSLDPNFMRIGWDLFKTFANLGFVLGIIVVAIATILRYKAYQASEVLWRLIVAAVLVNFSFVFIQTIISICANVSMFFLSDISRMLDFLSGDTFGGIKATDISGLEVVKDFTFGVDFESVLALSIQIVVFLLIFLVLMSLALMMFFRFFVIAFLTMISPLVVVAWAFPSMKSHWEKWKKYFIDWAVFPVFMSVFLYLTLTIVMKTQTSIIEMASDFSKKNGGIDHFQGSFANILFSLFSFALIFGGMIASKSLSKGTMDTAINLTKKTGDWAKTKVRRTAARGGRAVMKSETGTGVKNFVSRVAGTRFGKLIGAGALSRGMVKAEASLSKQSAEHISGFRDELKNLGDDEVERLFNTFSGEKRVAAIQHLAEKGKLGKVAVAGRLNIGDVSKAFSVLGEIDGKAKGELEKSFGMTEDMYRALIAGESEKIKVKKVTYDSSGRPDVIYSEKDFNDLAEDFFKGFKRDDWQKFLSNRAKEIFDKRSIPGLDDKQSKIYREFLMSKIKESPDEIISAVAPKLSGEARIKFYNSIIKNLDIDSNAIYTINQESDTIVGPDGKKVISEKKVKIKEEIEKIMDGGLKDAVKFNKVMDLLDDVKDPAILKLVKKIRNGMGSALLPSGDVGGGAPPDQGNKKP